MKNIGTFLVAEDIPRKKDVFTADYLFGDGTDGDVTISGSVTLARDMHYNNLTISAGAALNPAGYIIFVKGALDLSAAPAGAIIITPTDGNNGAEPSGAAAVSSVGAKTLGGIDGGGAGGNGYNSLGHSGDSGNRPSPPANTFFTVNAGEGGHGGTTTSYDGGWGPASTTSAIWNPTALPRLLTSFLGSAISHIGASLGGGGGGGGAAEDGISGGGGSGGGGAGCIAVFAKTIVRGTNATVGIISAKGGNGGNGAAGSGTSGGGGGGSGAGGGLVYIVFWERTGSTISDAIDVSSGAGGNGGDGSTGGGNGRGGGAGQGGRTLLFNVQTGTVTATVGSAATAQSGDQSGVNLNRTEEDL